MGPPKGSCGGLENSGAPGPGRMVIKLTHEKKALFGEANVARQTSLVLMYRPELPALSVRVPDFFFADE
jgi:hypothetical protein